jgi:DNA-binding response OmpR family regulator
VSRILVVEDEPAILRGLVDNLTLEGHDVVAASDGVMGYRMVQQGQPDLLVLDLMMPRMSGYELCRKLRADGVRIPILILSARGEEADRILGLDIGADDYMSKPFSIRELIARVRALLRRAAPTPSAPETLAVDDIEVDFLRYEARRGSRQLEMTRKEFGVLRLLVARSGDVVTRDALLREVWGSDASPTTRTVDNHVASLRAKLEEDPSEPRRLITVHGVGYKWVTPPRAGDT